MLGEVIINESVKARPRPLLDYGGEPLALDIRAAKGTESACHGRDALGDGSQRLQVYTRLTDEIYDITIIGGGPVGLFGAFYAIKAVTRPMLKAKGGRIINITSVSGQAGPAARRPARSGV